MTLIDCSIFHRSLYKVSYIFHMSCFVTGFASDLPQQDSISLGCYGPDLSSVYMLRIRLQISSEKSQCTERHSERDVRSQVFLLPKNNTFCFTVNCEVQAAYYQVETWQECLGFSCSRAVPSCPHSLPAPFFEGKNRLKWTTCQLSAPPYKCGNLSQTAELQCTRMILVRKTESGVLLATVFLQITTDWPTSSVVGGWIQQSKY